MPGFLDTPIVDVAPLTLASDGEYQLKCIAVDVRDSKATLGNRYLQFMLQVMDLLDVPPFPHRINIPSATDDTMDSQDLARRHENFKRAVKNICEAFRIDSARPGTAFVDGNALQEFIGQTAWAPVGSEPEGGQFAAKNRIVGKFTTPK